MVYKKTYLEGTLETTFSGNAYLLMPENEEDVFIARRNTNRALDGDRVIVNQIIKNKKERREAVVVKILERSYQNYIGILDRREDFGFVNPIGSKNFKEFFI